MPTGPDDDAFDVFLSHSSADKPTVRALASSLRRHGVTVWLDEERLRPGALWQTELEAALSRSPTIIVAVGPEGAGRWEKEEVQAALILAVDDGRPVIPVLLPGAPHDVKLPLFLKSRSWVDLRQGMDSIQIARLAQGITDAIHREPHPVAPAAAGGDLKAAESELFELLRQKAPDTEIHGAKERLWAVQRELKRAERVAYAPTPSMVLGNRFQLISEIGSGGFATVWRALDRREGHEVAVKILHMHRAGDHSARARFLRGAREMSEFRHPNVVPVLAAAVDTDHPPWFVMELIEGPTLHAAIEGQAIDRERALAAVLQVGQGLATLHARGRVHRDVNPRNILLQENGRALLTDFDLIWLPHSTNNTQGFLGTWLFAAPEMMEGRDAPEPRSDIFSLAMTLLYALKGSLLLSDWRKPRDTIRRLDLPKHIANALQSATSEKPEHRPQSMQAFLDALTGSSESAAPSPPPPIVGIDFGTTYSAIACFHEDHPQVILTEAGDHTIPSVVWVGPDGQVLVGRAAEAMGSQDPARLVRGVKRHLGTDWNLQLDDRDWTASDLAAHILGELRAMAERHMRCPVRDVVLTHPAQFGETQIRALIQSATLAGLNIKRMIVESTAASLVLLHQREDAGVLVFDLGGGTLDVSVIQLDGNVAQTWCTVGDLSLGGEDFTRAIVGRLFEEVESQTGLNLRADTVVHARLTDAAEAAKIALSSVNLFPILVPALHYDSRGIYHFQTALTRAQLEEMVSSLVERAMACCREALRQAQLKEELDAIVLVGLSARMPLLRARLGQLFPGKPVLSPNPETAVASGAAIRGGVLHGDLPQVLLLDLTAHSLGIEVEGGVMCVWIQRFTTIPTQKTISISTSTDNQRVLMLSFFQGERAIARENRYLGCVRVTDIPPAASGVPKYSLTFDLDANQQITVTLENAATHEQNKWLVSRPEHPGSWSGPPVDRTPLSSEPASDLPALCEE